MMNRLAVGSPAPVMQTFTAPVPRRASARSYSIAQEDDEDAYVCVVLLLLLLCGRRRGTSDAVVVLVLPVLFFALSHLFF